MSTKEENNNVRSRVDLMRSITEMMRGRIRAALEERKLELSTGGDLVNQFIKEESGFDSWQDLAIGHSDHEEQVETMEKVLRYLSGDVILLDMDAVAKKTGKEKAKSIDTRPSKGDSKPETIKSDKVETTASDKGKDKSESKDGNMEDDPSKRLASLIREVAGKPSVQSVDYEQVKEMIDDAIKNFAQRIKEAMDNIIK